MEEEGREDQTDPPRAAWNAPTAFTLCHSASADLRQDKYKPEEFFKKNSNFYRERENRVSLKNPSLLAWPLT